MSSDSTPSSSAVGKEQQPEQQQQQQFVQVIDEHGKYIGGLTRLFERTGLIDKGIDYDLLAVFGCQSSGKSTLMNLLFGTDFPMMNSAIRRGRTSKGVCVSKAKQSNIVVFDMEGTDALDRGEDDMAFERKTSLFALATTEVLIVNMWMQDIGRFNASNYALLKTVFELNLQLFARNKTSKILLLFVIRDHTDTPLELLRTQILGDIAKIWSSIMKPDDFLESKADDFFDFDFYALPHMKFLPDQFKAGVDALRERFTNPEAQGYVFQPQYKKAVPIDGFEHYVSTIWETILTNKDLDLPTHKEMLATYRCGSISTELYADFEKQRMQWHNTVVKEGQTVRGLGAEAKKHIDAIMAKYGEMTHLYFPRIVEEKRVELENKMKSEVQSIFHSQLKVIRQNCRKSYEKLLAAVIPPDGILDNYKATSQTIEAQVTQFFLDSAKDSVLPGGEGQEGWDYQSTLKLLKQDIYKFTQEQAHAQIQRLVQIEKKAFVEDLAPKMAALLDKAPHDMWPRMRDLFKQHVDQEASVIESYMKGGFDDVLSEEELAAVMKQITAHGREYVRGKVKETASLLAMKMKSKFDRKFSMTSDNLPRVWKAKDNILAYFKDAREAALELLDLFFLFRFDEPQLFNVHLGIPAVGTATDVDGSTPRIEDQRLTYPTRELTEAAENYRHSSDSSNSSNSSASASAAFSAAGGDFSDNIILTEVECVKLYEMFVLEIKSAFISAQRNQQMNSQSFKIPMWAYFAILFLGWNELMYLFSSPLLLLGGILVGALVGYFMLKSKIEHYLAQEAPLNVYMPVKMILSSLPSRVQIFDMDTIEKKRKERGDGSSGSNGSSKKEASTPLPSSASRPAVAAVVVPSIALGSSLSNSTLADAGSTSLLSTRAALKRKSVGASIHAEVQQMLAKNSTEAAATNELD